MEGGRGPSRLRIREVTVRKREGGFGEAKNQRVWPGAESAGVRGGRDPGGGGRSGEGRVEGTGRV